MKLTLAQAVGLVSDDDLVKKVKAGDNAAFNELLNRHDDLLQRKASAFSKAPIPNSAVYAQAVKILRHVADRYQPSSGAQFRTFLESNLRLTRFVNTYKNVARIPEHRSLMVGRYQAAKHLLSSEKDRSPSQIELAEHLGWSLADVSRMEQAISRRELSSSGMQFDQLGSFQDRIDDSAELMYYSLSPEEQLVFDYSMGRHGHTRITDIKEMSKKTGITPDRIYTLKKRLAQQLLRAR
jgi:DNA-directed RNA polymerase specialized sigma subunit